MELIKKKDNQKKQKAESQKNAVCKTCGKDTFTSMKQLEIHINAKHNITYIKQASSFSLSTFGCDKNHIYSVLLKTIENLNYRFQETGCLDSLCKKVCFCVQ